MRRFGNHKILHRKVATNYSLKFKNEHLSGNQLTLDLDALSNSPWSLSCLVNNTRCIICPQIQIGQWGKKAVTTKHEHCGLFEIYNSYWKLFHSHLHFYHSLWALEIHRWGILGHIDTIQLMGMRSDDPILRCYYSNQVLQP